MKMNCLAGLKKACTLFLVFAFVTASPLSSQIVNQGFNNSLSLAAYSIPRLFDEENLTSKGISDLPKNDLTLAEKKTSAGKPKINFRPTSFTYPENAKGDVGIAYYPPKQLILYAKLLKEYAIKKGYDTTYVFLCNMALVVNKKRFFIFNMTTMRIEDAGLVSQGRGHGFSTYNKKYSNEPGSNCTALGRYKVSGRYTGEYGESFKLYGLDSTNNKAFRRRIVLHSMPCIPDTDAAMPACASEGCPAVSENFFQSLKKIITSAKKPILMWVFDSNLQELVEE